MKTTTKLIIATVSICVLANLLKADPNVDSYAILYTEPDFRGEGYRVTPDDEITSFAILANGRWSHFDDEISSIEIHGDLSVEAYSSESFRGRKVQITTSVRDLSDVSAYDRTIDSSTAISANKPTSSWDNRISSAKMTIVEKVEEGVTLWDSPDQQGEKLSFNGIDAVSNLTRHQREWSSWNDAISSIQIVGLYKVKLYEHPQFQGRSIVIDQTTNLSDIALDGSSFNWDKRASSLEILGADIDTRQMEPVPNQPAPDRNPFAIEEPLDLPEEETPAVSPSSPASTPAPSQPAETPDFSPSSSNVVIRTPDPAPKTPNPSPFPPPPPLAPTPQEPDPLLTGPIMLFEHANFRGRSLTIHPGEEIPNLADISRKWNDEVSSIQLPDGAEIAIFEDAFYTGKSIVIKSSIRNLSSVRNSFGRYENWNDKLSSIQVLTRGGGSASSNNRNDSQNPNLDSPVATCYEKASYKGFAIPLYEGQEIADLGFMNRGRGNWNDVMSSIRIHGNVRIRLFEHTNFQGNSAVIDQSQSEMALLRTIDKQYQGWNDRVSSLRVERVPE